MSWISKNLTLDLLAIAIHGMQSAFDRIKSEPESDWPPAEVPQQAPAAVEQTAPAPQQEQPAAPAPEPEPQPEPAAAPETAPQPAPQAETPQIDRRPEAQTHLRDISLAGGMDWITQTLFPQFGVQNLNDIPADQLPSLIEQAAAYKLEKGLG